jgi:hypothetical protein
VLELPILRYFAFDHLPEHLQQFSRPFAETVNTMMATFNEETGDRAELVSGLRKLLEAKDCFVRANLS